MNRFTAFLMTITVIAALTSFGGAFANSTTIRVLAAVISVLAFTGACITYDNHSTEGDKQ